jgi:hypothetical protein
LFLKGLILFKKTDMEASKRTMVKALQNNMSRVRGIKVSLPCDEGRRDCFLFQDKPPAQLIKERVNTYNILKNNDNKQHVCQENV